MITDCTVALNGISLHTIDTRIITQRIAESQPSINIASIAAAGRTGIIITGKERQYIDVSVEFSVKGRLDYAARAQVIARVNEWAANGGTLTVNYRPGQRLRVACWQLPEIGYVREWLTNYVVVFRTLAVPYWEDSEEVSASVSALANNMSGIELQVGGTERTPLSMRIVPRARLTSVLIRVGGQKINLSGMSISSGSTVTIEEDENGIYQIANNGKSLHAYRTADSSDVLMLNTGGNIIYITPDAASSVTASARGRWV